MAINTIQKATAQSIVSIFETGRISGADMYATISNNPGDTGGLSYGKHQVTLNSGNLYLLIKSYCDANPDESNAAQFALYMQRLLNKDATLGSDSTFLALLQNAATTIQMQQAQDAYFDRLFWAPTDLICSGIPWVHPVSWAIVYDSHVQGAWATCRDLTNTAVGSMNQVNEVTWIIGYLNTRRNWLANSDNAVLRTTVYRIDAFLAITQSDRWDLQLPLQVRGVTISNSALGFADGSADDTVQPVAATSVASAMGDDPVQLPLYLKDPPINSELVSQVQAALTAHGFAVSGGLYDPVTQAAVKIFQATQGLVADGIVGDITMIKLGLAQ